MLRTRLYDWWFSLVQDRELKELDIIAIKRGNYKHYVVILYKICDLKSKSEDDYMCVDLVADEPNSGLASVSYVSDGSKFVSGSVRQIRLSKVAAFDKVRIHNL